MSPVVQLTFTVLGAERPVAGKTLFLLPPFRLSAPHKLLPECKEMLMSLFGQHRVKERSAKRGSGEGSHKKGLYTRFRACIY